MDWQKRKQNLYVAFSNDMTAVATIIGAALIMAMQALFTDFQTLSGNMETTFTAIEIITGILLSLLFGMNIGLLWYKLRVASGVNAMEGSRTLLGGFLGLLVTGCPACSITLASYLGLAGIISAFPFSGLEVKIAGVIILLYSTDSLLKNLLSCKDKSA